MYVSVVDRHSRINVIFFPYQVVIYHAWSSSQDETWFMIVKTSITRFKFCLSFVFYKNNMGSSVFDPIIYNQEE